MRRLTWKLRELLRATMTRRAGLRRRRLPVASVITLETMEPRSLPTATASGVISGVAFIDAGDVNGNRDSGELTVRGVPVRLTGSTSQGTSVNVTTTTTASGAYTFGNVLPGTYRLTAGPAQNLMGGAVTGSDFTVTGGQTVTRDLALGGIRPERISLRMFLTTTTPESIAAEAGFAAAGSGQAVANERENNLPELASGTTTFELGKNEAATIVDLASVFTDPDMTNSQVSFQTSVGNINVELFDTEAPQTVANFLNYVNDNRYDNTIIHRLISGFVAQGGGFRFDADNGALLAITKDPPVANEFGASNTLGTIAMAKLPGDPDSATNEFFFNLGDNSSNLDNQNGGFTVFGRLVGPEDQEVLDILAETDVQNQGGTFNTIPLVDYDGTNFPSDAVPDNFVTINDIQIVRRDEFLSYSLVSNSNNSLVTTSITNNRLSLSHTPETTGTAQVTIRATDRYGATFDSTFAVNIVNHAPSAAVSVTPNAPVADATLTATATKSDADGDTVTLTYAWTVNGNVVQTTANSTSLTDTLDLSTLVDPPQPGDIVQVRVTPNDGEVDGTIRTATTRVNQAPVVDSLQLSSESPTTNTLLTATVAASDADSDPIGLTYIWKVNNVIVQSTFNSTSRTNTLDLGLAGHGDIGDQITIEVAPSDGKVSGTTASASATVANSVPAVDSLMLSPNAPVATETITATATASDADGQAVTVTYVWKVNGEVVRMLADTTSLTDALDLSLLSDLTPGTPVTVEVTPNDGLANGAIATASTQINREPVIQSVGLTPDVAKTNATLTATVAASDADGDPISLTYVWKVNDAVVQSTANTSSLTDMLDLSVTGNGNVGDVVTVEVTPNDGKVSGMPIVASTTVADTAPTVDSLSLAPLTPAATQTVTATASVSDDDGQAVTLTYVWSINGTVMKTTANTSNLTDDFDLSLFPALQQGDVIAVEVTPHDGSLEGEVVTASTHINTRPLIGFVELSNHSPTTNETVTATVTTSDADDDPITLTYVWKVNDVVVRTTSNTTSLTDTLDLSVLGNGDVGDQMSLVVTPSDGKESGPSATSSAVVADTLPTVDSLTLSPTTVLITTTSLTATATTSDDDGHAVTLTYVWKLNGEVVQTTENTASLTDTLDLSLLSQRQPGDAITVEVTPNDGLNNGTTATVSTAINRAPVVDAIQLSPIAPTTNTLLTATVETHDAESDPITLTYVWKVNGVVARMTTNTSSLADTFDLSLTGNGNIGDQISLEVTPSDGKVTGTTATASVMVANSAPVVDSVVVTPSNPIVTDTLTATVTVSDDDDDAVTVNYVWKVNGGVVQTTLGAGLTDTIAFGLLPDRSAGDVVTVEVTPNDGTIDGATVEASVTIVET